MQQLAKIREIRDRCPKLEHVILMVGSADDALIERRVRVDERTHLVQRLRPR